MRVVSKQRARVTTSPLFRAVRRPLSDPRAALSHHHTNLHVSTVTMLESAGAHFDKRGGAHVCSGGPPHSPCSVPSACSQVTTT